MKKLLFLFLASYQIFAQDTVSSHKIFDSLESDFYNNIYKDPKGSLTKSKDIYRLTANDNELLCRSYQMLGISYLLAGKSDSSRVYFVNAIEKSRLLKDKKYFIKAVVNYSNLEVDNIQNKNLLKLIYEALNEIEKSQENKNQKGKLLMFLGEISFNNKEYIKAEEQYKKALFEGDKQLSNSIYRGLEAIHFHNKKYTKALLYAKKSLQSIEQKKSINYSVSLIRIGRNYLKLNQTELAKEYILESKKLQQELGIKSIAGETSIYLSEIDKANKNIIGELKNLKDAQQISKESRNYFQLKRSVLKTL